MYKPQFLISKVFVLVLTQHFIGMSQSDNAVSICRNSVEGSIDAEPHDGIALYYDGGWHVAGSERHKASCSEVSDHSG